MKAEICPVCKGIGKYVEYLNYYINTAPYTEKTCHGCNGRGWVSVPEEVKYNGFQTSI